jgi:hypothetical protein
VTDDPNSEAHGVVNASLLEFLDWIAQRPRTYHEAMEAWKTHCPRLSTWEDALAVGLIEIARDGDSASSTVRLTPAGTAALNGAALT